MLNQISVWLSTWHFQPADDKIEEKTSEDAPPPVTGIFSTANAETFASPVKNPIPLTLEQLQNHRKITDLIVNTLNSQFGMIKRRIDVVMEKIQNLIDETWVVEERFDLVTLLTKEYASFKNTIITSLDPSGNNDKVKRAVEAHLPIRMSECIQGSLQALETCDIFHFLTGLESDARIDDSLKNSIKGQLLDNFFAQALEEGVEFSFKDLLAAVQVFNNHPKQKQIKQLAAKACIENFNKKIVQGHVFKLADLRQLLADIAPLLNALDFSAERAMISSGKYPEKVEYDPLFVDAYSTEEEESGVEEDNTLRRDVEMFRQIQTAFEQIASIEATSRFSTLELTSIEKDYNNVAAQLALPAMIIEIEDQNDSIMALFYQLEEVIDFGSYFEKLEILNNLRQQIEIENKMADEIAALLLNLEFAIGDNNSSVKALYNRLRQFFY